MLSGKAMLWLFAFRFCSPVSKFFLVCSLGVIRLNFLGAISVLLFSGKGRQLEDHLFMSWFFLFASPSLWIYYVVAELENCPLLPYSFNCTPFFISIDTDIKYVIVTVSSCSLFSFFSGLNILFHKSESRTHIHTWVPLICLWE